MAGRHFRLQSSLLLAGLLAAVFVPLEAFPSSARTARARTAAADQLANVVVNEGGPGSRVGGVAPPVDVPLRREATVTSHGHVLLAGATAEAVGYEAEGVGELPDDELTLVQVPGIVKVTHRDFPRRPGGGAQPPWAEVAELPKWLRVATGVLSSLGQPILLWQAAGDELAGKRPQQTSVALAQTAFSTEEGAATWLLVALPVVLLIFVLAAVVFALHGSSDTNPRASTGLLYARSSAPSSQGSLPGSKRRVVLREDWPRSPAASARNLAAPAGGTALGALSPMAPVRQAPLGSGNLGRPAFQKPIFSGDPGRPVGAAAISSNMSGVPPPLSEHFILSVGDVSFKMSAQALLSARPGAQSLEITGLSGHPLFHAHLPGQSDGSCRLEISLARDWEAPRAAIDCLTLGASGSRRLTIFNLEGEPYGEMVPPDPSSDGRRFVLYREGREIATLSVQDGPTLIQVRSTGGQYLASTCLEGFVEGSNVSLVFKVSPGVDSILMVIIQLAAILTSPHTQQTLRSGRF